MRLLVCGWAMRCRGGMIGTAAREEEGGREKHWRPAPWTVRYGTGRVDRAGINARLSRGRVQAAVHDCPSAGRRAQCVRGGSGFGSFTRRMNPGRPSCQFKGKKYMKSQQNRWMDVIKRNCSNRNMSVVEACRCWYCVDLSCCVFIICPIAIAYSMGQIIKSVCVCVCVCPSASTLTVAFLDRFSRKLAQT